MTENEAIFEFINVTNIPTDTYYFTLTSKCCCKGKCGVPPVITPTGTKESPTGTKESPTGRSAKQLKEAWKIALIAIVVSYSFLSLL
ncbi:uncharacterized protein LOC141885992 isoform X2 [Acropora palmata]|uniref:uncharacterized protein LOC141885841 isoform X2 n=1 Tax=Acropora palmata TaxID=6131 RepID=UPI003DA08213